MSLRVFEKQPLVSGRLLRRKEQERGSQRHAYF